MVKVTADDETENGRRPQKDPGVSHFTTESRFRRQTPHLL